MCVHRTELLASNIILNDLFDENLEHYILIHPAIKLSLPLSARNIETVISIDFTEYLTIYFYVTWPFTSNLQCYNTWTKYSYAPRIRSLHQTVCFAIIHCWANRFVFFKFKVMFMAIRWPYDKTHNFFFYTIWQTNLSKS